jgi:hypothetical protein
MGNASARKPRRGEPVDSANRKGYFAAHGDFAISPRGDMPKYRVPFL